MTESVNGKEIYTTAPARSQPQKLAERSATIPIAPPASTEKVEEKEEDDLEATVPPGTVCKRAGCKVIFVSNEENRTGDGPGTMCVHHPGAVRLPAPRIFPCIETCCATARFPRGEQGLSLFYLLICGIVDVKRLTRVTSVANVVYSSLRNFSRSKGVRKGDTFSSASRRRTYVMY